MTTRMKDEATLNQQVEELRDRMRILRKFYIIYNLILINIL